MSRKNDEIIDKVSLGTQQVHTQIEDNCRREISTCQENLYHYVSENSMQSNSLDALLLPSLPDSSTKEDKTKELNGLDRVDFLSSIQKEQEKTRKALQQVKHYRDLAEKLRKEKRTAIHNLNEKIELVRDFWRNKICEGSTRAGKMVQRALLQNKTGHLS